MPAPVSSASLIQECQDRYELTSLTPTTAISPGVIFQLSPSRSTWMLKPSNNVCTGEVVGMSTLSYTCQLELGYPSSEKGISLPEQYGPK
jgi:hypothetical protein